MFAYVGVYVDVCPHVITHAFLLVRACVYSCARVCSLVCVFVRVRPCSSVRACAGRTNGHKEHGENNEDQR